MNTYLNNTFVILALFVAALASAGCGGSLRREYRSDLGTAVADPFFSSVDTRGALDACRAQINAQRDSLRESYCSMTGGCSREGAVTETTTTTRLSMSEFCEASPSAAICRDMADTPADRLPTLESTTTTRRTEPGTVATGIDAGMAFFATAQMASQDAAFCQAVASQFGAGMGNLPVSFWQAGAVGMPFGMAMGLPGMGGFMGMGGFAAGGMGRGQVRFPVNFLLPDDITVTVMVFGESGETLSQRPVMGSGRMTDRVLLMRPMMGNTAIFQWQCSNGRMGRRTVTLNGDFTVTPDLCGLDPYAYMASSY